MLQIIELLNKLLSKENITFALSVFGSLGTIFAIISQRKKLSVSMNYYNYKDRSVIMYVSFINQSHLPISITGVSIVIDKVCYPCVYVPTKVLDYTHKIGKEVVGRKEILSIQFPISLSSLAGTSGYLYFDTLPNTYPYDPKTLTLQVTSNRGKAKKIQLPVR